MGAWRYRKGNREHGPVSWSALQELASCGRLGGNDAVRAEGTDEWRRAGDVSGLFDLAAGPDSRGSAPGSAAEAADLSVLEGLTADDPGEPDGGLIPFADENEQATPGIRMESEELLTPPAQCSVEVATRPISRPIQSRRENESREEAPSYARASKGFAWARILLSALVIGFLGLVHLCIGWLVPGSGLVQFIGIVYLATAVLTCLQSRVGLGIACTIFTLDTLWGISIGAPNGTTPIAILICVKILLLCIMLGGFSGMRALQELKIAANPITLYTKRGSGSSSQERPAIPGLAPASQPAQALSVAWPCCPGCGILMHPEATLCVRCGFDLRLGRKRQTTTCVDDEPAGSDTDADTKWPTVLGVIAIIFGCCGALGELACTAPAELNTEVWSGDLTINKVASFAAALLLLAAGVGLLKRQRWSALGIVTWAICKMLIVLHAGYIVGSMGSEFAMAMMAHQRSTPPPPEVAHTVLLAIPAGIIVWGWALPAFMLIWFSRGQIRGETACW